MNSDSHQRVEMLIITGPHGIKLTNKMESFGHVKMKMMKEHHICFWIRNSIILTVVQKYLPFHIVRQRKNRVKSIQLELQMAGLFIIIYLETKREELSF